jgi:uncharacterized protein (TIGR02246 family)
MMKRAESLVLLGLVLAIVACPCAAQERREVPPTRTYGEPVSPDDGSAIQALLAQYKDSWSRQDTDAFIALHAEDTEWINAYARLFQGSAPLAEFIRNRLFPAFDSDISRQEIENMRTISMRYLGDDAAVVHLYTEGQRGESRNEGEDVRRTHLHLVLSKQNAVWKIVHTAIMDAR